jgi:hypothetical protein
MEFEGGLLIAVWKYRVTRHGNSHLENATFLKKSNVFNGPATISHSALFKLLLQTWRCMAKLREDWNIIKRKVMEMASSRFLLTE